MPPERKKKSSVNINRTNSFSSTVRTVGWKEKGSRSRVRRKRKIGRKIILLLLVTWLMVIIYKRTDWQRIGPFVEKVKPQSEKLVERTFDEVEETFNQIEQMKANKNQLNQNNEVGFKIPEMTVIADSITASRKSVFDELLAAMSLKKIVNELFVIDTVIVVGNYSIHRDAVINRLGDVIGLPLYDCDLDSKATLINQLPRVENATLSLRPPHTLMLKIKERREVATLLAGKEIFGIDHEGMVFELPGPGWPVDLPVIVGYKGTVNVGNVLMDPGVMDALRWIESSNESPEVAAWIDEVIVNSNNVISLLGKGNVIIQPGSYSLIAQVLTLRAVFSENLLRDVRNCELDLRFPGLLIRRESKV